MVAGVDDGQAAILDYEGFSFLDEEYKQLRQSSELDGEFDGNDTGGVYLDEGG